MVFHSTLPEVLTGLGVVHPEDKGVLLLFALGRIGVKLEDMFTAEQHTHVLNEHTKWASPVRTAPATMAQYLWFYKDGSHSGPAWT